MTGLDLSALVADHGDVAGEYRACREACALFDFSFVQRARVSGTGALAAIAALTARPMHDLAADRIRYALRAGPGGVLISDLTVWNLGAGRFEVMSGRRRDIGDLVAAAESGTAAVEDLSPRTAIFAVQGPLALTALAGSTPAAPLAALPYFGHGRAEIAGVACRVGRLGYSGEAGFEIVCPAAESGSLWSELSERARPAGFAAANILRIEAGFLLFANEFQVPVTAGEVGLERFAGKGTAPPRVRLACFRAQSPKPPPLWQPGPGLALPPAPGEITVTSACDSPAAGGTLGLGYLRPEDCELGRSLRDPRGDFHGIRVAPLPFYDPEKSRPRRPWRMP